MPKKLLICMGILSLCCWSLLFSPMVPAAHASAPKPPCYGSSFYGLDPFATKCGIVTSYNSLPHLAKPIPTMMNNGIASGPTVGTIINYYSTWCNANWAEATMTNTTGISINIAVTQPNIQQKYEPASGFTENGPFIPALSKAGMNGRSFRAGWVEGKHHSS